MCLPITCGSINIIPTGEFNGNVIQNHVDVVPIFVEDVESWQNSAEDLHDFSDLTDGTHIRVEDGDRAA